MSGGALRIAVGAGDEDPSDLEWAAALAKRLNLPLLAPLDEASLAQWDFLLRFQDQRLSLSALGQSPIQTISVDFDDASLLWRQKQSLRNESVVRAIGGSKSLPLRIVDATAGLGQDSFILASAGFTVHMIEASPIVHALLEDGLRRGASSSRPAVSQACARLQLEQGDSGRVLSSMAEVDIVYLDPMFPERRKAAKVKKNMQVLQQLLEAAPPSEGLLQLARQKARRRVVVKRPRHSEWLEGEKPSMDISGKSSRFDIYLC